MNRFRLSRWLRRSDAGFTLVELVVCITFVGIISGVMAAVFSVVLRTVPDVDARTDEARTLQGVVTWLPQDVDSTPPTGFDQNPASSSGCTLSPGVNLLRMEWTENVGTPVRYVANYRVVPINASLARIERVTCFGSGASPLGNSRTTVVSAELPGLPVGWTAGNLPMKVDITTTAGEVELVTFQVRTQSGKIVRTDSAPKNPANTLTPTTFAGTPSSIATTTSSTSTTTTTTIPSGTTTTLFGATTTTVAATTTTVAPTTTTLPCAVTGATLSSNSMRNVAAEGGGNGAVGTGVLRDPVTLTITTNGNCSGVEARAQTAPNGELFRNGSASGLNTFTVFYPGRPQGSSELWTDGTRAINIYGPNGSLILRTITLEIR